MSKKRDKQSDLSTEFMQSLVDQNSAHTVEILTNCPDAELKKLVKSIMSVGQMLLLYAAKRGIDISEEATIVIELPDQKEN